MTRLKDILSYDVHNFTFNTTDTKPSYESSNSIRAGKKGSNFFCCGAIRFLHIKMFSFLRRECLRLQKGSLQNKMCLNSAFKDVFCVKRFPLIIRVANNKQEKFTVLHVPHIGFLFYLDVDEIVLEERWIEKRD